MNDLMWKHENKQKRKQFSTQRISHFLSNVERETIQAPLECLSKQTRPISLSYEANMNILFLCLNHNLQCRIFIFLFCSLLECYVA